MKEDLLSYWRLNLLFEKFVRASVDLSATSSQNGLIREASFLAETFLIRLTTQRRVMLYSRGFWSIGCPRSWHASSWYWEVTQAHVKLRQIYALPNVIILFLRLLFSHFFLPPLWIWPGGSYLCDQAAVNRAAWQTAEEPEMKSYFYSTEYRDEALKRISDATYWTAKTCNGCVIRSCYFILLSPNHIPLKISVITSIWNFVHCLSFQFRLSQKYIFFKKWKKWEERKCACVLMCAVMWLQMCAWERRRGKKGRARVRMGAREEGSMREGKLIVTTKWGMSHVEWWRRWMGQVSSTHVM